MGGELGGRAHPGVGNARCLQCRLQLRGRDGGEHLADHRGQLVMVGDPVGVAAEPGIGEQVRAAQDVLAQHRPFTLVLDAQEHLAVLGRERAVRGDGGVPGAGPRRWPVTVHAVVERLAHPLAERVQHGDLDAGPPAGPLPLVQRGEHAGVGVHARGDVGDGNAGLGRLALRAGHREQAGLALHEQVVGLLLGVRAVRAIARDRAGDQPRVAPGQFIRAQAQPLGRPGGQVLHEHVGPAEQRVQHRPVRRVLYVELDALLAPVQPDEVTGLAVHGPVVAAGEVAAARPLHLDHPGTQVGQLPGGERSRHRLLQRDHQDAVQC